MAFTQEQQAVIDHTGGHCLVKACAGAGKTHTMVAKIVRLISSGVDPGAIMVIQFNRSAKEGFENRLRKALGNSTCPMVRTFNSVGAAMLKRLNDTGAIPPRNLTQSQVIAKRALSEQWRSEKGSDQWPSKQEQADFISFIGLVKSDVTGPRAIFEQYKYPLDFQVFIRAFELFETKRKAARQHSFDDQIYDPILYLSQNPEHWKLFENRFDEIIIDEFQDANAANFALLEGLAGTRANLTVIGDANQSIYGFRGSSPRFIMRDFQARYPETTVYPMTRNFRYGHQTSLMANHVISHSRQADNLLTIPMPSNPDTQAVFLPRRSPSDSGLVDFLKPFVEQDKLNDCAVLVRYYSASIPIEIELTASNIPYHCYGREPLLHVPEIACLYAALCLSVNRWPEDEPTMVARFVESMLTFPNIYLPEDIQKRMLPEIADQFLSGQKTASQTIKVLAKHYLSNSPNVLRLLNERADVIDILGSGAFVHRSPTDVIGAWIALTKMDGQMQKTADRQVAQERMANMLSFKDMAKGYATVPDMLDALSPMAAEKAVKPPSVKHVIIQSIHRSKGLEYPCVILPGWTQNSFPRPSEDEEEDRRLAYVAITRATEQLVVLTSPDLCFEVHCAELDRIQRIGYEPVMSPFLYQAEPGLSMQLAKAITGPDKTQKMHWRVRDASTVRAYVEALGLTDRLTFSECEESQLYRDSKPIPESLRLKKGDQVWHKDLGACTVVKFLYDPVYMVKPNSPEPAVMKVISERQGWRLLHKT